MSINQIPQPGGSVRGAITGNPEGTPPSLDEVRHFRLHPFVGLFGGGPRMVPSRLRVASGYPLVDALFDLGMIPDAFRSEPGVIAASQAWRLLEAIPINRTDDALQLRDAGIENVVQDYAEAMIGELERAAHRKARKLANQANDEDPIGLQFLSFVQAVITGTPFHVCFTLNGEPAQGGCCWRPCADWSRRKMPRASEERRRLASARLATI